MEILELVWENLVDIILGILLIKNTAGRSAKKQAKFEEKTAESKIVEKRKRLNFLREDDKKHLEAIKNNQNEELKLEKELNDE